MRIDAVGHVGEVQVRQELSHVIAVLALLLQAVAVGLHMGAGGLALIQGHREPGEQPPLRVAGPDCLAHRRDVPATVPDMEVQPALVQLPARGHVVRPLHLVRRQLLSLQERRPAAWAEALAVVALVVEVKAVPALLLQAAGDGAEDLRHVLSGVRRTPLVPVPASLARHRLAARIQTGLVEAFGRGGVDRRVVAPHAGETDEHAVRAGLGDLLGV